MRRKFSAPGRARLGLTGRARIGPVDRGADHAVFFVKEHGDVRAAVERHGGDILRRNTALGENIPHVPYKGAVDAFRVLLRPADVRAEHGVFAGGGTDRLAFFVQQRRLGGAAAEIDAKKIFHIQFLKTRQRRRDLPAFGTIGFICTPRQEERRDLRAGALPGCFRREYENRQGRP